MQSGTARITDREDCSRTCDKCCRNQRLTTSADQACDAREETKEGKGSNTSYTSSFSDLAKVEAALETNQQSANDSGRHRERFHIPRADQVSRFSNRNASRSQISDFFRTWIGGRLQ